MTSLVTVLKCIVTKYLSSNVINNFSGLLLNKSPPLPNPVSVPCCHVILVSVLLFPPCLLPAVKSELENPLKALSLCNFLLFTCVFVLWKTLFTKPKLKFDAGREMDKVKVALVPQNAIQQQHKLETRCEQQLNTSHKWYLGQSCCVGLHQVQRWNIYPLQNLLRFLCSSLRHLCKVYIAELYCEVLDHLFSASLDEQIFTCGNINPPPTLPRWK